MNAGRRAATIAIPTSTSATAVCSVWASPRPSGGTSAVVASATAPAPASRASVRSGGRHEPGLARAPDDDDEQDGQGGGLHQEHETRDEELVRAAGGEVERAGAERERLCGDQGDRDRSPAHDDHADPEHEDREHEHVVHEPPPATHEPRRRARSAARSPAAPERAGFASSPASSPSRRARRRGRRPTATARGARRSRPSAAGTARRPAPARASAAPPRPNAGRRGHGPRTRAAGLRGSSSVPDACRGCRSAGGLSRRA